MNIKYIALAALAATSLMASQSTLATIVTSNISETSNTFFSIGGSEWVAQSFTVATDQDYTLTDVQAVLDIPFNEDVILGSIYSDSGSNPGILLEQLTTGVYATPLLTFSSYGLNLTAGVTYWLVFTDETIADASVGGTSSTNQTSLADWSIGDTTKYSTNSGGSWTSYSSPRRMAINAEPAGSASVPEPATWALMGIAGLGFLRRRKAV